MGTVDNIFILRGVLTHLLNNNKKVYTAFVDFTKAFDYLVRDVIWYKLIKFGIREKLYNSVRSRIKYYNTLNEDFIWCLGVRQG